MDEFIKRKCGNCRFFPCMRLNCKKDNICNQHEFEHQKIIKEAEKGHE